MWLSTYILLPIGIFLMYKANNDSNLFNVEWYYIQVKKWHAFFTDKLEPILKKFRKK